jgi:hypothetical protein
VRPPEAALDESAFIKSFMSAGRSQWASVRLGRKPYANLSRHCEQCEEIRKTSEILVYRSILAVFLKRRAGLFRVTRHDGRKTFRAGHAMKKFS